MSARSGTAQNPMQLGHELARAEEWAPLGVRQPGSTGYHNLPAELTARPQWVVWRAETRGGGPTKVPYVATARRGRRASSTNPSTWRSFIEAAQAADDWADGIGFVFSKDDPFVAVDLDHVLDDDGTPDPQVVAILRELDSYTERSPSGTGLHVIVNARFSGGRKTGTEWGGFEIYGDARFLTFTGHPWMGVSPQIEARQAQLERVLARVLPGWDKTNEEAEPEWEGDRGPLTQEDEKLLERARRAENGEKFERLWRGETADYHSESEGDLALASLLAFWTGPDPRRIERLLWNSGLAREKWNRRDYLPRTIGRALAGREDFYTGSERARNGETAKAVTPGFTVMPFRSPVAGEGPKSPTAATAVNEVEDSADIELAIPLDDVGRSARELIDAAPPAPPWLVPGFIARGWLVKLAGREKAGKGTLIAYLLGALERGDPTLFGPSERVTALIYSEEPVDSLSEKLKTFHVERATVVHGWELSALSWDQKAHWLVAKATHEGHGLIFADNVSRATGTEDEAGTELSRKVELLADLAKPHALAVLIDHHHRKSGGKIEDRSRGGTGLAGACENNVELERRGDWESRERRLSSRGRLMAATWEKEIELSEDGTDYVEANGDDFRVRVLREREEWTASDFAGAIDRSTDVARKWLNECPRVKKIEGSRGVSGGGRAAAVYRVVEPEEPSI